MDKSLRVRTNEAEGGFRVLDMPGCRLGKLQRDRFRCDHRFSWLADVYFCRIYPVLRLQHRFHAPAAFADPEAAPRTAQPHPLTIKFCISCLHRVHRGRGRWSCSRSDNACVTYIILDQGTRDSGLESHKKPINSPRICTIPPRLLLKLSRFTYSHFL